MSSTEKIVAATIKPTFLNCDLAKSIQDAFQKIFGSYKINSIEHI